MQLSLENQLRRDEGVSTKLYYDSMNIPTIGVGFNLKDPGLMPEEIDFILKNRIRLITKDLLQAFPWAEFIDEPRRNALLNMAYNMGITRLRGFKKFLVAMEARDWNEASNEMLNSIWHSQVPQRSMRLAEQVRKGVMI